ncbi:MAG: NADH-quinone oxidoreductase subunit H [Myxococcota bacterium]|nr:NADH-quinone oxidoreductase subunit H [Myxococcota bacterium]
MSPETLVPNFLGLTAQALSLALGLLAVGVPLVAWAERKAAARIEGRPGIGGTAIAEISLDGMLQPLADALKLLSKRDPNPPESGQGVQVLFSALVLSATVVAFSAIPWSGRYVFGEGSLSLILADVEMGVLFIFALLAFSALVTVWAGMRGGIRSRVGTFRLAARSLSGELALLLALLPMLMIYGSLRLGDMVAWQDASFSPLGAWSLLAGGGGSLSGLSLGLPAWGILLNPLAFILVLTAASVRLGLAPFDAERREAELEAGPHGSFSGPGLGFLALAARLELLLVAALVTLIFFGGWAIPWLPQATLVAVIGEFIGSWLANAICLGLHLVVFLLKLSGVVFLELLIRSALPRFDHARTMALCWKILMPAALVDIAFTAAVLFRLGGAPG